MKEDAATDLAEGAGRRRRSQMLTLAVALATPIYRNSKRAVFYVWSGR